MAIYRLIASGSFGDVDVAAMVAAYESALVELQLRNRNDPITDIIARAILNVTATGERDPDAIRDRALHALGIHRAAA